MKSREACIQIRKLIINEPGLVAIFNNGSSVVGMNGFNSDLVVGEYFDHGISRDFLTWG